MPMMETSASARPSFRRPIPFTIVTIGRGVWAAAPVKLKRVLWPAALCNPANAAVAAACFRKLRRSIPPPVSIIAWTLTSRSHIRISGLSTRRAAHRPVHWIIEGAKPALLDSAIERPVGLFGAIVILAHNLLDPIHARTLGGWSNAWYTSSTSADGSRSMGITSRCMDIGRSLELE